MKTNHSITKWLAVLTCSIISLQLSIAFAQGTAFTFQGRLLNNGSPASGTYNLAFTLFDTNTSGVPIAGPVTNSAVSVNNGLFTVLIDFGPGAFAGATNWLEIAVETNGINTFTTLAPRQQLTPTPQSIYALNAGTAVIATSSTNFSGSVFGDVSGTQGATVVASVGGQTAANVASGVIAANSATSSNLPNTFVARDGSGSFSAGSVILGGSLYMPYPAFMYSGTNTVLVEVGSTFLGLDAGFTEGQTAGIMDYYYNVGIGDYALYRNLGMYNTAIGEYSMYYMTNGYFNTGSGYETLYFNTNGSLNTASGWEALSHNASGSENTANGSRALYNNITGNFNTAVGYYAGINLLTGNNDIYIGNQGTGENFAPVENYTIRIGSYNVANAGDPFTNTYIAGIWGTVLGSNAQVVAVDSGGHLGTGGSLNNGNAATLDGLDAADFWQLNGNTVSVGQFLGSINNQPVEFWVNDERAFRLEPDNSGSDSPNVIGGSPTNYVVPGMDGGTIGGGGGIPDFTGFGGPNSVTGSYGTVGGGLNNSASWFSTVGGGLNNTAPVYEATVGGGAGNSASDSFATVGGGTDNTASGYVATVGGGANNNANGYIATVSGGQLNTASGVGAFVGGGGYDGGWTVVGNSATGNASVIGGGLGNAAGNYATVAGGAYNQATSSYATIPGGQQAVAMNYAQLAYSSGMIANPGDSQYSLYVLRGTTAFSDPGQFANLYLDGSSSEIYLGTNRSCTFTVKIVGRDSSANATTYTSEIHGGAKTWNSGQYYSVYINPNPPDVYINEFGNNVSATVGIDATDMLHVRVIGGNGNTIHWTATVETAEVAF